MDEEQRRRLAQVSINTQPRDVSRLPADNVNRSILSQGVPPFPTGAQATIAKPEVPATAGAITGELRGRGDVISGGRMGMDRTPIQTPRGTIYATQEQAANMMTPRTLAQQSSRSPAEQQALLAQMRQAGAGIRERIAATNAREAKENLGKYYVFRQQSAERTMQEALTPKFGTTIGRGAQMRGAQAMVEASRFGEAARTGRLSSALEPVKTRFGEFALGSMGQYSPMRPQPSGGPQPTSSFGTVQSSFGMPSATGSIASGYLPSFLASGGEQKDEYLRRNLPQDYFTGAFGSQGRNMTYRPNSFDQTRTL